MAQIAPNLCRRQLQKEVPKTQVSFRRFVHIVSWNFRTPIPQNAPEISGAVLGKIIQWANHHKDDPEAAVDDQKKEKPTDEITSWDAELLQVDEATLFQIIRAANYLIIEDLLDVACKKVAKMIKGKTVDWIRQRFGFWNVFSPDEEEQVRKENTWCECARFGWIAEPGNVSMTDEIPAKSVQHVDNTCSQVIEDCFTNSVVVRKIFQQLSNQELMELSCVNRLWNSDARSVMKKRGNVIAHLSCGSMHPCRERIEAFGAHLSQMNVVPYSGIGIAMNSGSHGEAAAVDLIHKEILDRLVVKHLSVSFFGRWWNYKDCPALLLVKKIFQDFSGILETLTLNIDMGRDTFVEHFVQDCSFPGLKVLKLEDVYDTLYYTTYTSYMKDLVSRAPNLHMLHTAGPMNLTANVLEGSKAVLFHHHEVCNPFGNISESVIDALRLEKLVLQYTGPYFDLERFKRLTPTLLKASSETLCSLTVDAVLAVPLMCYGICFENVNHLVMAIHNSQLEVLHPRILSIIKDFDFTHIFPNVNKVEIICPDAINLSRGHMNTIIEQADAILREPIPDRAAYVKELYINSIGFCRGTVPFFAEMFPNVEKLEVVANSEEQEIPFGSIWEHWVDLKELNVT